MHEVSIALGMVSELERIAEENSSGRINSVKLKIGKMSGIVTDSLLFAFDAVKAEHPIMADAELVIEEVPLIYECDDCGRKFGADDFYFPSCPDCGSGGLKIISGEEQNIESVELEA